MGTFVDVVSVLPSTGRIERGRSGGIFPTTVEAISGPGPRPKATTGAMAAFLAAAVLLPPGRTGRGLS